MTKQEEKYWEKFKEKYGEKFKRVSAMTSSGAYFKVNTDSLVTFEKNGKLEDETFVTGDLAEYIYDLEDIKEEALVMFKKYNRLLEKYNKLKGE